MEKECTIKLTREQFLWISSNLITLEKLYGKVIPIDIWNKLVEAEKQVRGTNIQTA